MVTQFLIGRLVLLRAADQDSFEGQGLVEYALIILLMVIGCLVAITGMSDAIRDELWALINGVLVPAM